GPATFRLFPYTTLFRSDVDPPEVVVVGAQESQRGVGVAAADGLSQLGDRAGEAVNAAEDDYSVADRDAGRRLGCGHRLPCDLRRSEEHTSELPSRVDLV